MELTTVRIEKPDDINFVLGQSHFIKTVEDIHEALVQAVPGIKFGLAFCESSGATLVRWTGTDAGMIDLAKLNAQKLAAGHSFILFLGPGFFPVNILNYLSMDGTGVPMRKSELDLPGANAILVLRCSRLRGRFEDSWERHTHRRSG